jgi:hypothetical protein
MGRIVRSTLEPAIEEAAMAAQTEPTGAARRNVMERVIESVASGVGNGVGWLAESGALFVVFAILWAGFAAALVFSQGSIDQAWASIRSLPLLVQALAWLLLLPVMVGLWVWESSWPMLVRLIVVVGVAGWSLLIFLPKALQSRS